MHASLKVMCDRQVCHHCVLVCVKFEFWMQQLPDKQGLRRWRCSGLRNLGLKRITVWRESSCAVSIVRSVVCLAEGHCGLRFVSKSNSLSRRCVGLQRSTRDRSVEQDVSDLSECAVLSGSAANLPVSTVHCASSSTCTQHRNGERC